MPGTAGANLDDGADSGRSVLSGSLAALADAGLTVSARGNGLAVLAGRSSPDLVAVLVTAFGLVVITIAVKRVRSLESASTSSTTSSTTPRSARIDVVIPARNEGRALPGLLADLAAQTLPAASVVVVDDESTDDTAAVACAAGATVASATGRPPGWNPKVWAMDVGVGQLRSTTDVAAGTTRPESGPPIADGRLVFLDADVRLGTDAFAAIVAVAEQAGGLVSVAPYHCRLGRAPTSLDRDAPVALGVVESLSAPFNITIDAGGGPGLSRRARGAVGSCLTITRADYAACGGHAAKPDTIVDDLALAATVRQAGLPVTVFQSRAVTGSSGRSAPLVAVRSYSNGFGDLARGWIKNLSAGMGMTPLPSAIAIGWWVAAIVMPLALVLQAKWGIAAGLWVGVAAHTWWLAGQVGRFNPVVVSVAAPLLGVWFAVVSALSVFARLTKRSVNWKGRALRPDGVER